MDLSETLRCNLLQSVTYGESEAQFNVTSVIYTQPWIPHPINVDLEPGENLLSVCVAETDVWNVSTHDAKHKLTSVFARSAFPS